MTLLELDVPDISTDIGSGSYKPGDVQRWLAGLPKLNDQLAFEAVLGKLEEANRSRLAPELRLEIAECLIGQVEYQTEALSRRTEHLEFPLSDQERIVCARVQRLLAEQCFSYKRVVLDLAVRQPDDTTLVPLREALLQAVRLLALRILHAFSVYMPAAPGVWGELHRLYHYAERIDVARTRVEHLADQSIGDIYKRIVLLSLANPFHLMQGEVRGAYEKLAKWALACRIRHPEEYPSEAPSAFYAQRFYVDLATDAAPTYGFIGDQSPPVDARVLDIQPVVQIVEGLIRQMTLKGQLPVRERLERDLLRRLRNAWSGRPQRAAERALQQRDVDIVGGLRASHHAIGGDSAFHPEQDEVALHGGDFRSGTLLSLVPLEEESWKQEDVRGKLEAGMIRPRTYNFDVEHKDEDVWDRSQRVGTARNTQLEEHLEVKFANRRGKLRQHDTSATGLGAVCAGGLAVKFRVGDLVAIADDAAAGNWNLGVVCWLRNGGTDSIPIGLRRIHGRAAAVAVRGVEGMGADSDYHRALSMDTGTGRSLIVPAGIFDIGSTVLVNSGTELKVGVLRQIRYSTKGFADYLFEQIECPTELKEKVIQSLYRLLERAAR